MPAGRREDTGGRAQASRETEPGDSHGGRFGPVLGRVRERMASELNVRKDRATEMLDEVAGAVRRMLEPLREPPLAALGDYAEEAASRLERIATGFRDHDVAELADEVRGLARRRPAAFAVATFATGLLAARFLKSTSEPTSAAAPAGPAVRRRVPTEARRSAASATGETGDKHDNSPG